MDFNTFLELNESKTKNPKITVFKTEPSFKKVKELTEGDLYAVTNGDETFYWDDGKFTISLFPVTHNKDFFDDVDGNFVTVEIKPEYNTTVDDEASGFNSETGSVKHTEFLVYEGIDLKNSDYKIYHDDYKVKDATEEYVVEYDRYVKLAKSLKAKTIRESFVGDVEDAINKVIESTHDEIAEYEAKGK